MGYANLIGPDQTEQADAVYGPKTARLLEAKRAYDPSGVFSATPSACDLVEWTGEGDTR